MLEEDIKSAFESLLEDMIESANRIAISTHVLRAVHKNIAEFVQRGCRLVDNIEVLGNTAIAFWELLKLKYDREFSLDLDEGDEEDEGPTLSIEAWLEFGVNRLNQIRFWLNLGFTFDEVNSGFKSKTYSLLTVDLDEFDYRDLTDMLVEALNSDEVMKFVEDTSISAADIMEEIYFEEISTNG